MRRRGRRFYLDKERAKISGVCAGIADYMSWDVTLVRIGWVIATIFGSPVMIIAYIMMAWLCEPKPHGLRDDGINLGRDPYRAGNYRFSDVRGRFDRLETRLRTLEQVVTSREFQMDRELRGMGRV